MRYRLERASKFSAATILRNAALCGVFMAAGCTSNINEGVGPPTTVPSISGSAPHNTGAYPNLNIRPEAATAQLTPEELQAARGQLNAEARAAHAGASGMTPASEEERKRLLKLAEDHGKSVLADIEGQK